LQTLDVSIVKIDKAITQNATTVTGFIIPRNIIQTAKDIVFKALCEGVETEAQERAAIKAGCDLLQGYYYYRPMPVPNLFAAHHIHGRFESSCFASTSHSGGFMCCSALFWV